MHDFRQASGMIWAYQTTSIRIENAKVELRLRHNHADFDAAILCESLFGVAIDGGPV